jgi:hypothetical protein
MSGSCNRFESGAIARRSYADAFDLNTSTLKFDHHPLERAADYVRRDQQAVAMDEPVFWGRAQISWSREGYVLRAPLWVEERALYECEEALRQAVVDALAEQSSVSLGFSPMVVERTEASSSSNPGELEITTPKMISAAAARRLRKSLTLLLRNAIAEAERLKDADESAANDLLAALYGDED